MSIADSSSKRIQISSGARWEPVVGYSRAVRIGNEIAISGTTAKDEAGRITGNGNVYLQTVQTLQNIHSALQKTGATFRDVIRTRIFVRDISQWEAVARAHQEIFGEILVEIEADAVASS